MRAGHDVIYTYVAVGMVAWALGFGGAWRIQDWRANAHEKDRIGLSAEQERKLHAVEQAGRDAVIAAQNLARTREAKLRVDAAGARKSLDGLRAATDGAVTAARASHDACLVAAATTGKLLNDSTEEYRALAEVADRHVSDIRTLMDAQ